MTKLNSVQYCTVHSSQYNWTKRLKFNFTGANLGHESLYTECIVLGVKEERNNNNTVSQRKSE
jgi:hypothetical protein